MPMQLTESEKVFLKMLEKFHPTLKQIHDFIINSTELGYGEVLLNIKCHDYINKMVEMRAQQPKDKTIQVSVTKRIIVPSLRKLDKNKQKDLK